MTSPLLTCSDLTKRIGDRVVVDGLTLRIDAGHCYGLLGPNGAGKSTTIAMICGLLEPDSGVVRIAGAAPTGRDGRFARSQLGYVPQEVALFPELSLRENLDFWGRLSGLGRRTRRHRIDELLDLVGLADRADDVLATCSGGMQRRANLAAALLHEPRLLILDEPTVGVDPQSRHRLLDLIAGLARDGAAVLYTSHYMEEVERIADTIGILDHGVMIAEGSVTDVLEASMTGTRDLESRFLELTGTALGD